MKITIAKNLTKFFLVVLSVISSAVVSAGGWLDMSSHASIKEQVDRYEGAIQGQIRVAPGQNYRITKTTMTIVRQNGKLVNVDPPTGEHYVVIVDDDPSVNRYQAYSVNCDSYKYRQAENITLYKDSVPGQYGAAVAYAACHIDT